MKIYVSEIKKIKGVPKLVKKEVDFSGSTGNKIAEMQKKKVPYFEVVGLGAKTKMTYTMPIGRKNYIKKEVRV